MYRPLAQADLKRRRKWALERGVRDTTGDSPTATISNRSTHGDDLRKSTLGSGFRSYGVCAGRSCLVKNSFRAARLVQALKLRESATVRWRSEVMIVKSNG